MGKSTIISIDAEKSFEKNSYSFLLKKPLILGIKKEFSQSDNTHPTKTYYKQNP